MSSYDMCASTPPHVEIAPITNFLAASVNPTHPKNELIIINCTNYNDNNDNMIRMTIIMIIMNDNKIIIMKEVTLLYLEHYVYPKQKCYQFLHCTHNKATSLPPSLHLSLSLFAPSFSSLPLFVLHNMCNMNLASSNINPHLQIHT